MENQKGITLVALVVTIIVLLILAAVSISLVAGENGILSRATTAVDKTQVASAKEAVGLKVADLVSAYYQAKYVDNDTTVTTPGAYVLTNLNAIEADTEGNKKIEDYIFTVDASAKTVTVTVVPGTTITGRITDKSGAITWNE